MMEVGWSRDARVMGSAARIPHDWGELGMFVVVQGPAVLRLKLAVIGGSIHIRAVFP